MTPKTVEEVVESMMKEVTREDDGLLDIGKNDHDMLRTWLTEALTTRDEEIRREEREQALLALE